MPRQHLPYFLGSLLVLCAPVVIAVATGAWSREVPTAARVTTAGYLPDASYAAHTVPAQPADASCDCPGRCPCAERADAARRAEHRQGEGRP